MTDCFPFISRTLYISRETEIKLAKSTRISPEHITAMPVITVNIAEATMDDTRLHQVSTCHSNATRVSAHTFSTV